MLLEKIQLEKGEEIFKIVRKHWFVIIVELFVALFMALLPFFVLTTLVITLDTHTFFDTPLATLFPSIIFATSLWFVCACMFGYMIWTHYFLDVWVLTNRRVVLINQIHFFNRIVSSFRLERLQDMSVSINGVIGTLLNFGTIRAQTASAHEDGFIMHGVPEPRELLSLIQALAASRTHEVEK